jgi:hypothetical protein
LDLWPMVMRKGIGREAGGRNTDEKQVTMTTSFRVSSHLGPASTGRPREFNILGVVLTGTEVSHQGRPQSYPQLSLRQGET